MKMVFFITTGFILNLSFAGEKISPYTPYPTVMRKLVKLNPMRPDNTGFIDSLNPIKDQGAIASCASHGMMALLENQIFLERGITLQLSERFHLYSSFLKTANMGSDPDVISNFPSIISELGVMPSVTYPYADILENASRFTQDAAQGLHTDVKDDSLDSKIAPLRKESERSKLLQDKKYLGALPKGPFPIHLPLKVNALSTNAQIPEIEDRRIPGHPKLISCFSLTDEPAKISVTPKEFLNLCLDFNPQNYFSCKMDLENSAEQLFAGRSQEELCKNIPAASAAVNEFLFRRRQNSLNLTLRLLSQKQAVLIGLQDPAQGQSLPVWYGKLPPGAGHAVTLLGFLTNEELKNPIEHNKGLLKDGTFDALAHALDTALKAAGVYQGPIYEVSPQEDSNALYSKRLSSNLAKLMANEGGLLLFRNSWGATHDGAAIGVGGYQSMTFEYFLKNSSFMMSQQKKIIAEVSWKPGPHFCPVDTNRIAFQDPWIQNHSIPTADQESFTQILNQVCPLAHMQ